MSRMTKEELDEFIAEYTQDDRADKRYARVYFIREEGSGAIKIGMSTRVRDRFYMIQADNPNDITLLAQMFGGRRVEGVLHRYFESARIKGEWFRPKPELLAFIAALPNDCDARDVEELFEKRRKLRILA